LEDNFNIVFSTSELINVDLLNFSFLEFDALYTSATPYSFGTLLAIFLIFFNFLFKITAAPFHF
jgi:NADH:ubiquinone oxidoreductase subunit 2 (subunit N)